MRAIHNAGPRGPATARRLLVWGAAAVLLAVPWLAMRVTAEVAWTGGDFLVFGGLLAGACVAWEWLVRLQRGVAWRAGVALAIVTAFLLVWATLAVGVIGDEADPANRLVLVIPVIALATAALGRFQPVGMMRAMLVAATAQLLPGTVAAMKGDGLAVLACLCLAASWLLAAWLFRRAAATG